MRYRASSASVSSNTSDLSTNPLSRSSRSRTAIAPPAATASAASIVNPPVNTASRRNRICSGSVSSAWLHSIAPRRVRWRGRAVLLPEESNPNTSSSLAAICWGSSTRARAAASSMARGSPSRRRQICATAAAFSSPNANEGRTAWVRSTNNRIASLAAATARVTGLPASGSVSAGTSQARSPPIPSASRLVAMMRSRGQLFSNESASRAQASTRCSQLSSTSSASQSRSASSRASPADRMPSRRTPSASATWCGTSSGFDKGASSTQATPSG